MKDYKTAAAIVEEWLPRTENVFGSSVNETRELKYSLARSYGESLRYSDAAKIYEEILKSNIETYGETDEKTLGTYERLIIVYRMTGRLKEAGTLLDKAVPLAETNLKDICYEI